MTSYKEIKKANGIEKRQIKELERATALKNLVSDMEEFLKESELIDKVLDKLDGEKEAIREEAIQLVRSELNQHFTAYSYQQYRNTPHFDRFPDGTILVTGDADKFAELIDTSKSRSMECTGTSYHTSYFAYEQYLWKPILNSKITVINYGDAYIPFHSVDFNVEKPYVLFGWRTDWDETSYTKDAFKEKDGKQVETIHTDTFKSNEKIKRFSLLIYMPSDSQNGLNTYELAGVARNLRKKRKKRENPGFFSRLFQR